MRVVRGDLIALVQQGVFDVIVHGCNCYCSMEAGIARGIKEAFPEAYASDCSTRRGDAGKLGTISVARIRRGDIEFVVVNGYTQFEYTGPGVLVDYDAVRGVMRQVKEVYSGRRIGYPKIGAGLARGDWRIIEGIVNEELEGENHTLVEFLPSSTATS